MTINIYSIKHSFDVFISFLESYKLLQPLFVVAHFPQLLSVLLILSARIVSQEGLQKQMMLYCQMNLFALKPMLVHEEVLVVEQEKPIFVPAELQLSVEEREQVWLAYCLVTSWLMFQEK